MSAQDALRKAAGEIGYYAPADPEPGSKYGRWEAGVLNQPWLAGPSVTVWWCVIFVSWVLDGLAEVPGLPGYNTDTLRRLSRANTLPNMYDARPGDLVIFDWDKTTAATNHIGLVEINAGGYLQTIEGNTSGSDAGRQSNGNGVWRRTRSWDSVVAVIRPTWLDGTAAPVIPVSNPIVIASGALAIDGSWGALTTKAMQRLLGVTADGSFGPITIKALQRRLGVTADGSFGPITKRALQRRLGVTADGSIGPITIRAMQRALNAGRI